MKTTALWSSLLFLVLVPATLSAVEMSDYCSAPPYVTRTVAPNIMVLMDNSADMMNAAYPGDYTPNATNDNYSGYFEAQECYRYQTKFYRPDPADFLAKDASGNCTADAPFRGNLLNWATTSKYDLLQKVLVGGNTTSKQGNAHTVLAIGGTFPERTYNSCIFQYTNGNLSITESLQGVCSLLNAPPAAGFALNPFRDFGEMFARGSTLAFEAIRSEIAGIGRVLFSIWDDVDLVSKAWASTLTPIVVTGAVDAQLGMQYSITFEAGGDNNDIYYWSTTASPPPAWLGAPVRSNVGNKTDGRITWTGTPTAPGTYIFSVTATHRDGSDSRTRSFTIHVASETLLLVTSALSEALRDTYYEFTMTATGGMQFNNDALHPAAGEHYHWSATGLPSGFFINAATGKIYGIPTTNGSSTVIVTVTDASGESKSKTYTLVVIGASPLEIITPSLTSGMRGQYYLTWLEAAGGTPPYTWSQTGLPASFWINTPYYDAETYSTYIISSAPTVSGTFTVNVTVTDSVGVIKTKTYTLVIAEPGAGPLTIITPSILPPAELNGPYYVSFAVTGGSGGYPTWVATNKPAGMVGGLSGGTGYITWTPTALGTYTFTLQVTDSLGASVTKDFTLEVLRRVTLRQQDFNVRVDLLEETFSDANGNGIWDLGEFIDSDNDHIKDAGEVDYVESNGNGHWDGKKGVFQSFWDSNTPKARWGLTMFRDLAAGTRINVASCIPASPASSFFTAIQNATATNNSPLGAELYGAINYFGFATPYGSDTGNNFTGCTNSDPIDYVPCRKNFLLIISSGSNVDDGNKFTAATHPTDFPSDCNYTNPVVQNACYAYKKDLRPDSTGKQNIYTYVVNTMGTLHNDVLVQAADVGGGEYYDATDGNNLEAQLTNALQDILSQAASGTAVSVLTTSSRGIGSMMQAYFLPVRLQGEREVKWTGYAQNIWIDDKDNLREDTNNDFQLNLTDDKIVKLYFDTASNQTKAARFDTAGLDSCTPENPPLDFDDITYTWEAGKKLALKSPSTRTLFTSTSVIYDGSTTTFAPTDDLSHFPEFDTSMEAPLLNALNGDAIYSAENIVRYVSGECLETGVNGNNPCGATANGIFRDRRVTVPLGAVNGNVWKLGDIISSTPKVLANTPNNTYHIDYGDSSYYAYVSGAGYKRRSAMAFVGANDGVLHAFKVGYLKDTGALPLNVKALVKNSYATLLDSAHDEVGEEVWGYVPFNAFPYLKYLAKPDYCHIFYNDLSVRLVDASLGCSGDVTCDEPTDTRTTASWRTILVGGMRFGGACNGSTPVAGIGYSSYYALDVTDAEHPIPLWEFSDPHLGYASTFPSIVRTGGSTINGNWYVVVGSGSTTLPKNIVDVNRSTPGYVYFLDLKTGALVKKLELDHNGIVADILTIDANKDYGTENLYFGTAYQVANDWKGKIVKIDLPPADPITSASVLPVTNLLDDVYPFTASVDAAKDADGNIWVYAGSGKYYSELDETDASNQIIFGLKDLASPSPAYPWTHADLADQTNAQTTGTVSGTQTVCGFNGTIFTPQTVVTSVSNPTTTNANTVNNGWYVTLSNGERVITRPLAVGGLVDFLTYAPSGNVCSYGGSSYLYAFSYTTGLAPSNVAIRSAATTGGVTTGSVNIARGVLLGPGAPPTGEAIIIPPPKEGQEQLKKKIQIATGVIVEAENTPVISVVSKIVHWLKK